MKFVGPSNLLDLAECSSSASFLFMFGSSGASSSSASFLPFCLAAQDIPRQHCHCLLFAEYFFLHTAKIVVKILPCRSRPMYPPP